MNFDFEIWRGSCIWKLYYSANQFSISHYKNVIMRYLPFMLTSVCILESLRDRRDRLRSQKSISRGVGEDVDMRKLFRHALLNSNIVSTCFFSS